LRKAARTSGTLGAVKGSEMIQNQEDVTLAVLAVMERTANPRLREIMVSLVKHLHSFVRDVRLTEAEFREATAILNEVGKLTTDTHNELVLMAGSLGVSALVCLLNNGDKRATETSQSLLGPFWRLSAEWEARRDEGRRLRREITSTRNHVLSLVDLAMTQELEGEDWPAASARADALWHGRGTYRDPLTLIPIAARLWALDIAWGSRWPQPWRL
jgi:hypothetical protein